MEMKKGEDRWEFKMGGRENGKTLENAVKFIEYLDDLSIGKIYGVLKVSKEITMLTKSEVIYKSKIESKFNEKIIELRKIEKESNDNIEKEIAKGMAVFILMLKKELLEGDKNE